MRSKYVNTIERLLSKNPPQPTPAHCTMGTMIEGFAFSDFCERCQKVMEHKITLEGKEFNGTCTSCGEKRPLTAINQVFYPKTDLWVTRFKIGNLPSVVSGKLLDAAKHVK